MDAEEDRKTVSSISCGGTERKSVRKRMDAEEDVETVSFISSVGTDSESESRIRQGLQLLELPYIFPLNIPL
jgi:hypothetical protein